MDYRRLNPALLKPKHKEVYKINSADIKRGLELRRSFRAGIRALILIVTAFILLLVFSVLNVAHESAEFVIGVISLYIAGGLLVGALTVDFLLRRGIMKQERLLKDAANKDEASPWIINN